MQDRLLDTLPQFCQEDFGVGVLYDNTMNTTGSAFFAESREPSAKA
jgi:hypothetical protein